MASSLQCGLRAMPAQIDGVVVCLADMPGVSAALIARLAAAYRLGDDAVIPKVGGRRGNPVLLGRALFAGAATLTGDQGARPLLQASTRLRFIDADAGATRDIDSRRDRQRAARRGLSTMRRSAH